jgi:hypothetical protein
MTGASGGGKDSRIAYLRVSPTSDQAITVEEARKRFGKLTAPPWDRRSTYLDFDEGGAVWRPIYETQGYKFGELVGYARFPKIIEYDMPPPHTIEIKPKSQFDFAQASYPYLAFARAWGIAYGTILNFTDAFEGKTPNWSAADTRFIPEACILALVELHNKLTGGKHDPSRGGNS